MPNVRSFKGGAASSHSRTRGVEIHGTYYRVNPIENGRWRVEYGQNTLEFNTRREAQDWLQEKR